LRYIFDKFKTEEICRLAIKMDSDVIQFVPYHLKFICE
jgi:hypothetical protein